MRFLFNFFTKKKSVIYNQKTWLGRIKFFELKSRVPRKKGNVYIIARLVVNYVVALILSCLAVYLKVHYVSVLGSNSPFILLFSAVLISGWIGGLGPTLVATILCSISALIFFLPSFSSINIGSQVQITVAIFAIEGVLTGVLLEKRRRSDNLLKERIRQQAVISQLAHFAIASPNILYFYKKVSRLTTQTLNIKYCKILELLPGKKSFILRGGIGWKEGLVGRSIVTAGVNSQGGYTLLSEKPVIVKDLKREKRFYNPELLMSHGITSGMSVIIPGKNGPFGVFGVHSEKKRNFTKDDIYFTQAIANIMATAIEKRYSEIGLRESENRFKRLFDSNIIGAFISEFNGKFLDANDALLSLIEYSREELRQGKIHRDILTPEKYAGVSQTAVKALQTKGASQIYEKEYVSKSGKQIPVLIAVSRIDNMQDVCVGFVLDISKQKELERRKDEFIGMASHELKTPITSLKVLTQFLAKKLVVSKQTETLKYLEKINKQVDKLTDLINDLLDVTQMQAGKLKLKKTLFSMNDLVKEVCEDIQSVTTTHKIVMQLDSPVTLFGDWSRLSQVLSNLITNAIKYSPGNTQIIVSLTKEKDTMVVSVKDFGSGIDMQYKENIFEQFFRINENNNTTYPGLGMGLYISREIIARHQGKIWVESQPNEGSTFFFSLSLPEEVYAKPV